MAKFYIATRLTRHQDHNVVRDALVAQGHTITYDWTTHGNVKNTGGDRLQAVAHHELQAVFDADFVVFLLPGGVGTHVELGAALALGKEVILHSEDSTLFEVSEKTCAFYYHNGATQFVGSLQGLTDAFKNKEIAASGV